MISWQDMRGGRRRRRKNLVRRKEERERNRIEGRV